MGGRRGFLGAVLGLLALPFVGKAKASTAPNEPDPTVTRFRWDEDTRSLLVYDGREWAMLGLASWDERPVFDDTGTKLLGIRHTVTFEGIKPYRSK